MQISVASLRKAPGETLVLQADQDLNRLFTDKDPYTLKGPVHVQLKLTNTGHDILVEGRVKGAVEAQCGRCLDYFTLPVEVNFEERYCHREDLLEGMAQNKDLHIFDSEIIDVSDDIKDNILLNLPMKFICREECQGMCPQCGHNLNESQCQCSGESLDPRLEILKKLLPS